MYDFMSMQYPRWANPQTQKEIHGDVGLGLASLVVGGEWDVVQINSRQKDLWMGRRKPLWGRLGMDPDELGKGSGAEASSLRDSIFLIIRKWHPQRRDGGWKDRLRTNEADETQICDSVCSGLRGITKNRDVSELNIQVESKASWPPDRDKKLNKEPIQDQSSLQSQNGVSSKINTRLEG